MGDDERATPETGSDTELNQIRGQIEVLEAELAEIEKHGPNFRRSGPNELDERDRFVVPDAEQTDNGKSVEPAGEYVFGGSGQHYPPYRAQRSNLVGMSFSGGGIRSATFNLGVLQALADLDLLRRIDYLSAVSGGSYIAAWFSAWSRRQQDGVRRVQRWLSPIRSPDPDDDAVLPIRFLRRYSNYLAPRKGVTSPDSWAGVSIWLRNTVLNQFTLFLLLLALLLVPRIILSWANVQGDYRTLFWTAAGLLIYLSTMVGLNLGTFVADQPPSLWPYSSFGVQTLIVLAGVFVPALLASSAAIAWARFSDHCGLRQVIIAMAIVFSVGLTWSGVLGKVHRCFHRRAAVTIRQRLWAYVLLLLVSSLAGTVAAGLMGGILCLVAGWTTPGVGSDFISGRLVVFGPFAFVLLLSIAATIQIGLLGKNFPDERREWWGRLGALLLLYGLGWTGLAAIALYGPLAMGRLFQYPITAIASAIVWVVHTAAGVQLGRSPTSSAVAPSSSPWQKWVMLVAPPLFIVGILLLLSYGLQRILGSVYLGPMANRGLLSNDYWCMMATPPWSMLLISSALAGVIAFVWAWRIDVNEFSMHHFYRNRLVRCYLGASHVERAQNPFTGFDVGDDLKLTELRRSGPEVIASDPAKNTYPYVGPVLLVNTALNLVAGKELAWQERKAESFTFSPLYCGYEYSHASRMARFGNEGYRLTHAYAYPDNKGPSVGTVVGISGAAVNPNMGYHSSPALAFLMTLFNVRLGWWMGNTRRQRWQESSPRNGLLYMVNELLGNTNDDSSYINLSDGGHFENLGLYELVRRQCRYIVVCDSEEDRSYTFGGLGGAVRKCRTDFGVDIDIDVENLRPIKLGGVERAHCAVGRIRYPGNFWGKILYLKASLTGDEPVDVKEYSWREDAFPHQSTADQFFNESQFESYRALGRHVGNAVLAPAASNTAEELFRHLEALWSPDPPGAPEFGPRHSAAYGALLRGLSGEEELQRLDPVFFAGTPQAGLRQDHYAFAFMIEFMHEVMRDTGLDTRFNHPRLEGWITTFRLWARSSEFQRAWRIVRSKYDVRFRTFVEQRLISMIDP